jgi:hypothetical protein
MLQLTLNVSPFFRVGKRINLLGNIWPDLSQFGVELQKLLFVLGQFIFTEDGIHRTFWFTQSAINALIRVDDEKIRAFIEAIYGAYLDTVCMFALDAGVTHHKCHY